MLVQTLSGNAQLFSKVAPIYAPASCEAFLALEILANTWPLSNLGAHLVCVKRYLAVTLICIYQITDEAERLSVFIPISSLVIDLFISLLLLGFWSY